MFSGKVFLEVTQGGKRGAWTVFALIRPLWYVPHGVVGSVGLFRRCCWWNLTSGGGSSPSMLPQQVTITVRLGCEQEGAEGTFVWLLSRVS